MSFNSSFSDFFPLRFMIFNVLFCHICNSESYRFWWKYWVLYVFWLIIFCKGEKRAKTPLLVINFANVCVFEHIEKQWYERLFILFSRFCSVFHDCSVCLLCVCVCDGLYSRLLKTLWKHVLRGFLPSFLLFCITLWCYPHIFQKIEPWSSMYWIFLFCWNYCSLHAFGHILCWKDKKGKKKTLFFVRTFEFGKML